MKIFWSWQSETPGSIGRHLVREALVEAISGEAGGGTLYEARREEGGAAARPSPHGPPETGRRIFRQIRECDLFVADLTVPGAVMEKAGGAESCSPDVAIELGYFRVVNIGADLIVVVNTVYARETPFLRHPGGASLLVTYHLPEGSGRPEIGRAKRALVDRFDDAFRECGGPPAAPPRIRGGLDGPGPPLH